MPPPPDRPTAPEALLADFAWVRELALRLVRDPGTADDVAQEAWLAGARRLRRVGHAPRWWLGGVVRNLARLAARGRARRRAREERAAREEAVPSAGEVAARIELHRLLSEELSRLEEPFQTAVALRYVEGLSVERIAAATGAPAATVRTRVKRGLDRLRGRLDARRDGGGGSWHSLACAVLAHGELVRPTVQTGILAMNAKLIVAASAAVGLALWGLLPRGGGEAAPAPAAGHPAPAPVAGGGETRSGAREAPAEPAAATRPDADAREAVVASGGPGTLEVVVRGAGDGALRPLAFLRLAGDGPDEIRTVDAGGFASWPVPSGVELEVLVSELRTGAPRVTRIVPPLAPGEVRALRVELPPLGEHRLVGRVLEEATGAPIAGASVVLRDRSGLYDEGTRPDPRVGVGVARSDAAGRFELEASHPAASNLIVQAAGFTPLVAAFAAGHADDANPFEVRLLRAAGLEGVVTGANGAPQANVRVEATAGNASLGADGARRPAGFADPPVWRWEARTDAGGRFALAGLPARAELSVRLDAGGRTRVPELAPLVLEPGERRAVSWSLGARGRIAGEARDAAGRPYADGELWLRPRPRRGHVAVLVMSESPAPVDRARTDLAGRFAFEAVLPGAYILGPAAPREPDVPLFERPPASVDPEAVAPVGVPVDVDPASPEVYVELEVHRALYVVGRVEDVDGGTTAAFLEARVPGLDAARMVPLGEDGGFVLGPTVPGEHLLRAMPFPGLPGRAPSETVAATPAPAPGGDPVVLRLRAGRSLAGVVRGRSGAPAAATVHVAPAGEPHRVTVTRAGADGRFQADMLLADEVLVFAFSGSEVAVAGPLFPGPPELRLDLAPGGRVELTGDRAGWAVLATGAGAPCGRVRLEPGRTATLTAPAGPVVARWIEDGALHGEPAGGTVAVGGLLRLQL